MHNPHHTRPNGLITRGKGTFELSILDATGICKRFKGGHNHMVDRLHQLDAAGTRFDEFCFCNISSYQFP
jgi:hypothetical protein